MGIASFFKSKKEDPFVSLLIQQAQVTARGLQILLQSLPVPDEASKVRLRDTEYEGDEVRRILIDELHKTFVTPVDREDIYNISHHLDEMLDYAMSTLEEMRLLKVEADEHLTLMINLNYQAAEEMVMAMMRLQKNPRVALEHARRARKLEGEVENTYHEAIADLFTKASDFKPLMNMLRRREVYRHVSNMADQASMAAHVVGMVVMKLT